MDSFNPVVYIVIASFLLIIAGFFNFISSLYSDIDISKIDLSRVSRRKKKIKRLIYIIKNNYFLFIGTSVLSVIFSVLISRIIFEKLGAGVDFTSTNLGGYAAEILAILFLVFFTEILVRYLAEREFAKRRMFNPFLLASAYSITRAVA
jgi:hypothetical protein